MKCYEYLLQIIIKYILYRQRVIFLFTLQQAIAIDLAIHLVFLAKHIKYQRGLYTYHLQHLLHFAAEYCCTHQTLQAPHQAPHRIPHQARHRARHRALPRGDIKSSKYCPLQPACSGLLAVATSTLLVSLKKAHEAE